MSAQQPPRPDGAAAEGHHHDAFVSYSTHDKPVADAVVARLEQAGIRCWIAPRDVVPGDIWSESIVRAIQDSRLMVVVFSSNANASRQVLREVERAMASDTVVVPFRVESTEPSGAMAYFLATEHWLDAITPPLSDHIDQLVQVANALLHRSETAAPTASEPSRSTEQPPASPTSQPPVPATRPKPTAPVERPPRRRRTTLIAAGAVAAVAVAAGAIAVVLGTGGGSDGGDDPSGEASAAPWPAPLKDLKAGDCLASYVGDVMADDLIETSCDEPHEHEVIYLGDAFTGEDWPTDAPYPGKSPLEESAHALCEPEFAAYVGISWVNSELYLFPYAPAQEAWQDGERWLLCLVSGTEALQSSVKDSKQ